MYRSGIVTLVMRAETPQADNCEIVHGNLFGCRQGIDCLNYGGQTGVPPRLRNVNLQYLYRVFTVSDAYGGLVLDACYAESIRTLGNFGVTTGTVARYSMVVIGGTYDFLGHGSIGPGPAALVLLTYGPTKFIGTTLIQDGYGTGWDAFNVSNTGVPVSFDQCTFSGPNTAYVAPVFLAGFDTTLGQIRLTDCWVAGVGGGGVGFLLSDDFVRGYAFTTSPTPQYCPGGRFIATYQSRRIPNASLELIFQPYAAAAPGTAQENTVFVIFATVGSVSLSTSGAGSLTFTVQSQVLQPGDILMWGVSDPILGSISLPAVKVTTYSYSAGGATTATCSLLFDPLLYNAVGPPVANQLAIVLRHWAPAQALTCTTHGTTSITAVSPITILQNGDWLVGSGIAFGTRVVSGGGTASITLSQAATTSTTGVSLYFGRLYAPTLTAAY
jgi:hypothetical protein